MKLKLLLHILILFLIIIGFSIITNAITIFPSSLSNMTAYYQMNNNSNFRENDTFIYDFSNNQNNGTVSGAFFNSTAGYSINGAFTLDGINDFIQLDNYTGNSINSTSFENGFTISAWIYPFSAGESSVGKIVDKSTADGGANGFSWRFTANNVLTFVVNSGTSVNSAVNQAPFNEWTFVAVTINSSGSVTHYKNGIKNGASGGSFNLSGITTTNSIRIGQRSIATDRTFNGSIGSVIIFNETLNSSKILDLYDNYSTLYIDENYNFTNKNYNLTGMTAGSIIINNSNLNIDCNNANFYGSGKYKGIVVANQTNVTISNCNLYNYNQSFYGYNITNSSIDNFYILNSTSNFGAITLIEGAINNTIQNSEVYFSAKGIYIQGTYSISSGRNSTGNIVRNNIVINTTDNGIDLFARANNNTIFNNTVSFTQFVGILINRQSNYNIIDSNIVENLTEDGIQIRGLEGGAEPSIFNVVKNNVIINASYGCSLPSGSCAQGILLNYYSSNNTIQNNSVKGSNGLCFELGLGSTYNTFDSNFGSFCKGNLFEFNNGTSGYIYNNSYSNLAPTKRAYSLLPGSILLGFSGYPDILNDFVNNSLNPSFTLLNFTNMLDALIFNMNGSIYGNTSVNSNDGSINITLLAGNSSYVLDNFNLTEGQERQFSPLWFSSSLANQKKISSNLTDTINNVTTVINITNGKSCSQLSSVVYTSHTNTYTKTYISSEYTCANNQLTLTISGIEQSTGSNTLTLGYLGDGVCDAWEDGFSIDCSVEASPGGGGGDGSIENNTIIEVAKETIRKVENATKLTANQLLIIILVSVIGFSLLYRYLDEEKKKKKR